tara:strand:+ start:4276 stop:5805 length:1530 start_codon:yes stop_codon:yes gene_type:complete
MPLALMSISDLEGDLNSTVNVGFIKAPTQFDGTTTQVINLSASWNIISFYIDTTLLSNWDSSTYDTDVSQPYKISEILKQFLFKLDSNNNEYNVYSTSQSEFIANVIIVKDNSGSVYLPTFDFDSIHGLSLTYQNTTINGNFQGLQIKMANPGYYIKLSGQALQFTTATEVNFPLLNGWNLISYPSQTSVNVAAFFENLTATGKLEIAKDFVGSAYIPDFFYNGIGNMVAGQGYQLKVNNWTDGDTFLAKVGSSELVDIEEEEVVVDNDDVVIIDDTFTNTNVNMVIKLPQSPVIELVDVVTTTLTLDIKIKLLQEFLDKSIKPKTLTDFAPEPVFKVEESFVESEGLSNFTLELNHLISQNTTHSEPSGRHKIVQNHINRSWSVHKEHVGSDGLSLLKKFHGEIFNETLNFKFIAFSSNKSLIVGRCPVTIKRHQILKQITLAVKGDDTLVSGLDGLAVDEICKIYLFTGEQYLLISPVLSSGDLKFADKKIISVTNFTVGEELSTPL